MKGFIEVTEEDGSPMLIGIDHITSVRTTLRPRRINETEAKPFVHIVWLGNDVYTTIPYHEVRRRIDEATK